MNKKKKKKKSKNKNKTNFVSVNRLFVLVYTNEDANAKRFKIGDITHQKKQPKVITLSSIKIFYDQAIDSDIKQCEQIRKLTASQGEDYTTGCLLDYHYIKNHYRLISVDLSRQKELHAHSNAIQQI